MKKTVLLLACIFSSFILLGQTENYTIKNINANKKFQDFGVAYYGDSIAVFASSGKSVSSGLVLSLCGMGTDGKLEPIPAALAFIASIAFFVRKSTLVYFSFEIFDGSNAARL